MGKVFELLCLGIFVYFCIVVVTVTYILNAEPAEKLVERKRAEFTQVEIKGRENSYLVSLKESGKTRQIEVPITSTKLVFEKKENTYIDYERRYENDFMERLETFISLIASAKEDVTVLYIDKKILVGDEKEENFLE